MRSQLRLRFSKRFKEYLTKQKKRNSLGNPIPAIMFWSSDGDEEELELAFYDKDNLPSMDSFRRFESDGIEYLVPQPQIHDDLDGRVLDIKDGKIFVTS